MKSLMRGALYSATFLAGYLGAWYFTAPRGWYSAGWWPWTPFAAWWPW